jgi:hypothetical protein
MDELTFGESEGRRTVVCLWELTIVGVE